MANLANLTVKVTGDTQDFTKSLTAASTTVNQFASKAVSQLKTVTGSMPPMGQAAAVAGIAIAAGLAIGAKALYDIGKSFDDAYDRIRSATGATDKEMQVLEGVFNRVYQNVTAGKTQVADAVGGYKAALGDINSVDLSRVSQTVIELSKLTGTDLKQNVQLSAVMFGDWGIAAKDMSGALDLVYYTATKTGIPIQELMGQSQQFGATFRELGFTFEETLGILGTAKQKGVTVEAALTGLRKSISTLTAPTETATKAIEKIFGKEGLFVFMGKQSPEERFAMVTAKMREMMATGDKAQIMAAKGLAFDVFGRKGGLDITDMISKGTFEAGSKKMKEVQGIIHGTTLANEDFGDKAVKAWHKFEVAIQPIATAFFDLANAVMEKLFPAMDAVFGFLADHQEILKVIGIIFGVIIVGAIAAVALALAGVIAPTMAVVFAIAFLWENWQVIWGAIASFFVDTVWHGYIEPVLMAIVGFFTETLPGAFWTVYGAFVGAWQAVVDFAIMVPGLILGALGDALSWLWQTGVNVIQGLINGYMSMWGWVLGFFGGIGGAILGALGDLGSTLWGAGEALFNGFLGGAKAAWNAFATFWNAIEISTPEVVMPSAIPNIPAMTIGLPDLPMFEKGGIVPGAPGQGVPIMAHAGEMVVPADQTSEMLGGVPSGGMVDKAAQDALAAQQAYVDESTAMLLDTNTTQLAQQTEWQAQSIQGLTDTTAVLGATWTTGLTGMVANTDAYLTMLNVNTQGQYAFLQAQTAGTMFGVVGTMTAGASSAADSFVGQLNARIPPLQATLAAYGENVKGYGRSFLTSIGAAVTFAEGGINRAQIAPDGAWRVWAEQGTGGEAYIPRRGANDPYGVLSTAASWYGMSVVPFQGGGFTLEELFFKNQGWDLGAFIGTVPGHMDHVHAGISVGHVWQELDAYLNSIGIAPGPGSTTGGGHAAGSLHYAGRAKDYGDANNPVQAIFDAFLPLATGGMAAAMLARALVAGPDPAAFGAGIPAHQAFVMAQILQVEMQKKLDAERQALMDRMLAGSGVASGPLQAYAASRLGAFGWQAGEMSALSQLWQRESGWNPMAVNPSSGAWGIAQFLGADKGPRTTNGYEQIDRGLAYIAQRYGSPSAAWAFWLSHGWYKHGGLAGLPFASADTGRVNLQPGLNAVYNGLGRVESLAEQGGAGRMETHINFNAPVYGEKALEDVVHRIADERDRAFERDLERAGVRRAP